MGHFTDNLLHISSDSAIFDELCRRSLMFIHKYFFHSSNMVVCRQIWSFGCTLQICER